MTKKPTFFISSTIYDFADLRSAVKYNLEKIGCRVLASETNDFGNDLDKHSYEACLNQIDQADYFLLFIGTRVGGWYDKKNKISITRAEYQYAYERHKEGKLKIIPFVRQSVWDVREDRKALKRHIEEMALKEQEKEEISGLSSKFLSNPNHIIEFIKEVGRNEDTKAALKTDGKMPTGNWIYTFSNYSEIQDVLSKSVFNSQTYEHHLQFKNLEKCLLAILVKLHTKLGDKVHPINRNVLAFMKKYPVDSNIGKSIEIKQEEIRKLFVILLMLGRPIIDMRLLSEALDKRVFDSFDISIGEYTDTTASRDLFKLHELCHHLSGDRENFTTTLFGKNPSSNLGSTPVKIPSFKLLMLYTDCLLYTSPSPRDRG